MRYWIVRYWIQSGCEVLDSANNVEDAMGLAHSLSINNEIPKMFLIDYLASPYPDGKVLAKIVYNDQTHMVETYKPVIKVVYEEVEADSLVEKLTSKALSQR